MDNKSMNIPGGDVVKFNMGLATLENLRNLLNFYHKVSVMDSIEIGNGNFKLADTFECQMIRSRLCNHILLASRPLLKDDQKIQLEKELVKTEMRNVEIKDAKGKVIKTKKVFSYEVDDECDKFVSLITDLLQDNKVFMPGRGESSLF